ncbi:MAG: L-seryl-tRNA(Sec) selenium transferase [Halioglobus sp.]
MKSTSTDTDKNLYRELPSVDAMLHDMASETEQWGHAPVAEILRSVLALLRDTIASGEKPDISTQAVRDLANRQLLERDASSLKPILNLTGTVLHTNLGRASLPPEALAAVTQVASTPSSLEFNLQTGKRGDRESHIEALICELTGAEAATAVNNNAAAVLLTLNTLALQREVPVSRGELVEIGGSFRIPEVMQRSGCTLVEIGATNRTHLKDYRGAINENTAVLMKVHTSNYRVEGFTHAVDEGELAALAREHNLPFVIDLGSGNLVDLAALGLPNEPTARQTLENGADLITFSGDKLLGGPQAGLIAGKAELIQKIKDNPLKRALRLDKMTLAALAEVLKLYRDPQRLTQRLPTLRLLTRTQAKISAQAQLLLPSVRTALAQNFTVEIADCHSQIGSGSLPIETLPSSALVISPLSGDDRALRALAKNLRELPLPIIGRVHKSALWLDLRCLEEEQQQTFVEQLGMLSP